MNRKLIILTIRKYLKIVQIANQITVNKIFNLLFNNTLRNEKMKVNDVCKL